LITTFLIGSIAYLTLHWAWWYLEYNEREEDLKSKLPSHYSSYITNLTKAQLVQKEAELALLMKGQQEEESKKSSSKSSWFRFWRTN